MNNAALNALFARAEIFNKFEELSSQLTVEEAEIASAYLENLIKTRPIRRPESCSESGRVDTNCEFCAAGSPKYAWKGEDGKIRFFHKLDTEAQQQNITCEAAHAQN